VDAEAMIAFLGLSPLLRTTEWDFERGAPA